MTIARSAPGPRDGGQQRAGARRLTSAEAQSASRRLARCWTASATGRGLSSGPLLPEIRRLPEDADNRAERLGVLIRHELNTNGRPVAGGLLAELNHAWRIA